MLAGVVIGFSLVYVLSLLVPVKKQNDKQAFPFSFGAKKQTEERDFGFDRARNERIAKK